MKKNFLLFFLTVSSSLASEQQALESTKLYEQSSFWPPRVELQESIENPENGRNIQAGREGVLLRLNKEGEQITALVDFGRSGVIDLPLQQTDIVKRAQAIRIGKIEKEYANMTMMLGRGLVDSATNGGKVPLESIKEFDKLLIIYQTKGDSELALVKKALTDLQPALEAGKALSFIMPIGYNQSHNEFAKALKTAEIESYFMLNFLADPYTKILQHKPASSPFLVLMDDEGKTLVLPDNDESLDKSLVSIKDFLVL